MKKKITPRQEQKQQQRKDQQNGDSLRFSRNNNNNNDDEKSVTSTHSTSTNMMYQNHHHMGGMVLIIVLIVFLGFGTTIAFLSVGISGTRSQIDDEFRRNAYDTANRIKNSFQEYVTMGSYVHNKCKDRTFTRQQFRELYEYLIHDENYHNNMNDIDNNVNDNSSSYNISKPNINVKAIQFILNITHAERSYYENESRTFYQQYYPHVNYRGIVGFNELNSTKTEVRTNQSYYFPVHYMEPIPGNEAAIDLDMHSSAVRLRALDAVFKLRRPILSDRISLVSIPNQTSGRCGYGNTDELQFGVVLMHPGVKVSRQRPSAINATTTETDEEDVIWPRDTSQIVICMPDLLQRATRQHGKSVSIYVHDITYDSKGVFLGGVKVTSSTNTLPTTTTSSGGGGGSTTGTTNGGSGSGREDHSTSTTTTTTTDFTSNDQTELTFFSEIQLHEVEELCHKKDNAGFLLRRPKNRVLSHHFNIDAANRIWTITIIGDPESYGRTTTITFIVIGGTIIFLASLMVAVWVYYNGRRVQNLNVLKSASAAEKAALVLEHAQSATKAERELNDFLAHEVRNPVAAALAACNFLKVEMNQPIPLQTKEAHQIAKEDVQIIDNALHFVNDLLRNMLDMHRACANQLHISVAQTDLLHDVLEPVGAMLHQRGNSKVRIILECEPPDLCVNTDKIRLKQIMMNLGRNSCKFIDEGYIKLSAHVVTTTIPSNNNGGSGGEETTTTKSNVILHVDDSGSGIPLEKRNHLFSKYQESLDLLHQGTGIGLFLCKKLIDLMNGRIYLDDEFDSGVVGCPGTRFVIDLNTPPLETQCCYHQDGQLTSSSINDENGEQQQHRHNHHLHHQMSPFSSSSTKKDSLTLMLAPLVQIPDTLSVLFVDDDSILRKLFTRSVKALCPNWTIREAASGEAVIRLIENMNKNNDNTNGGSDIENHYSINNNSGHSSQEWIHRSDSPVVRNGGNSNLVTSSSSSLAVGFDLIFIDMYMASVEKQMLGTETVIALRQIGVTTTICGLSANDKETEFIRAGANAFMMKPFPCEKHALRAELIRILQSNSTTAAITSSATSTTTTSPTPTVATTATTSGINSDYGGDQQQQPEPTEIKNQPMIHKVLPESCTIQSL